MMDEKDLNDMVRSIEAITMCTKCEQQLCPPLAMCLKGHMSCKVCKERVIKCFSCEEPLFPAPKSFEALINSLPKKCANHFVGGCKKYSLFGRHEKICEFRRIECVLGRDDECTWSGTIKDWLSHKKEQMHLRDTISKQFFIYNVNGITSQNFCLEVNQNNIFIFISSMDGEVVIAARLLVLQKFTKKYYLMMKFLNNEVDIPLHFPVKVLDMDYPKSVDNMVDCVKIPVEALKNFVNSFDEIVVEVTAFEKM